MFKNWWFRWIPLHIYIDSKTALKGNFEATFDQCSSPKNNPKRTNWVESGWYRPPKNGGAGQSLVIKKKKYHLEKMIFSHPSGGSKTADSRCPSSSRPFFSGRERLPSPRHLRDPFCSMVFFGSLISSKRRTPKIDSKSYRFKDDILQCNLTSFQWRCGSFDLPHL